MNDSPSRFIDIVIIVTIVIIVIVSIVIVIIVIIVIMINNHKYPDYCLNLQVYHARKNPYDRGFVSKSDEFLH